ncbi:hypothetical protein CY35_08G087000 [Sphagnum magellanicum]|nr:hypothetical protein CY35_08G087000 [Sphagnum magellanicum]
MVVCLLKYSSYSKQRHTVVLPSGHEPQQIEELHNSMSLLSDRLQVLRVAFDHGYSPSCNNNNHPRESPVLPAPLRVLCLQGIQANNLKIDQPQDHM